MSVTILEPPARETIAEGALLFLEPSARRPRINYLSGQGEASELYQPRRVSLRNLRRARTSLDVEGFALARRPSSIDFLDEPKTVRVGRAEAAALVRDVTGAARVDVFDHTYRRRSPDSFRQPSTRVHVDYTARSGPQRVRDLFPDEADALLSRRVAFINVWRAVRHAAQDWPLALCDAQSVREGDLVATDILYADRMGEIYNVAYHPEQRWWFTPDLALDEAILIKCYDSRADLARFAPHTAFESPLTPPAAPPRESIEFRAIAFFD
ncbi:MAG: CmcJ/NvfI family oxidoreductase [Hyphomonadaceae bacterium]